MDHEELIEKSKAWLENYRNEIAPNLKTNVIYAPGTVAYLCDQIADLTLLILYLDVTKNLSQEEKEIQNRLEQASEEIYDTLNDKDKDFDKLDQVLKDEFGLELIKYCPEDCGEYDSITEAENVDEYFDDEEPASFMS